jgi:hypothetical protein
VSVILPIGVSLYFSTASAEASSSQAAPSVICELLPGVILP